MTKYALLLIIVLLSVCLATAGDTIINVWGTLDYGWIDANTFGMRFRGSEQTCQVEQDWPKSILLITNYARRLKENLFAWQVRKSRDGEILQVITNDFARARSYASDPGTSQIEEDAPYSEFQLLIPKIFDDNKMFADGDQIELRLCWFTQVTLFSFIVPAPPFVAPTLENGSTLERNEPPLHGQPSEADTGAVQSSPSPATGGEPAAETGESQSDDQLPEGMANDPLSPPSSPAVQEEVPEVDETPPKDQAAEMEGPDQSPSPDVVAVEPVPEPNETRADSVTMEESVPSQEEPLRSSYVQGETIHYSFPPPTPASHSASLAVIQLKPGEEPILVYSDDIPYDPATGQFTIRLDTTDLSTGFYELIVWITGEMEPHRTRFQLVPP